MASRSLSSLPRDNHDWRRRGPKSRVWIAAIPSCYLLVRKAMLIDRAPRAVVPGVAADSVGWV